MQIIAVIKNIKKRHLFKNGFEICNGGQNNGEKEKSSSGHVYQEFQ